VQSEKHCELVTVAGDAGVGKSRLVAEFLTSIEVTVLRGRCLPYGEGITYWPVVEVLKQLGVRPPEEAAAVAIRSLLGETEAPTSAEEIAWAFRKTLEHAAAERPLVVVFDDIQWGEETFLDLIEHVALLSSGASILLLCMARPGLGEHRPTWPVTLRLEPLRNEDVDELIPERITGKLRERIARAAGGNPLFVEEMLAMARETDGEVIVPPTLRALLAAFGEAAPWSAWLAIVCVAVGAALKWAYWLRIDGELRTYTAEAATGLGHLGKVRARSLRLEFGLGALVRGEWRITDARLEGPEFAAGIDAAGHLDWSAPKVGFKPDGISIERLHIQDGRAIFSDAASGSRLVLEQLEFRGELRSLSGPVKGEGAFVVAGERFPYRVSTGRLDEDSGVKVRLTLDPTDRPLTAEADMSISLDHGAPHFEGHIQFARPVGRAPAGSQSPIIEPWRLASRVKGDGAAAVCPRAMPSRRQREW
jgi:hypothetical protein